MLNLTVLQWLGSLISLKFLGNTTTALSAVAIELSLSRQTFCCSCSPPYMGSVLGWWPLQDTLLYDGDGDGDADADADGDGDGDIKNIIRFHF